MIRFLNAYFPTRTVVLGVSEVMLAMAAFAMTMVAWFGFHNVSASFYVSKDRFLRDFRRLGLYIYPSTIRYSCTISLSGSRY